MTKRLTRRTAWVVGALLLSACGGQSATATLPASSIASTTTAPSSSSSTTAGPETSSTTIATTSTSTAETTTSTQAPTLLGAPPVPFRTASLSSGAARIKEILDQAGVTVNPYFDSCIDLEITGWDPARSDIDVFVNQSGTQPCPGDPNSRFFMIRANKVVLEVNQRGDSAKYLAIRTEFDGRKALNAKVGGGARWGFDAFDEVVFGAPIRSAPTTTSSAPSDAVVSSSAYGNADMVTFSSPSANVVCIIMDTDEATALCGTRQHDWTAPRRDCGPTTFQGDIVVLKAAGVVKGYCAGGEVTPATAKILPYGSKIRARGFECSSAESGMTCTHMGSRHGFTVSRQQLNVS